MMKNYTFTIDQFWPFFFDRCVQFVQLTTVDIRINRLVPWKKLKKDQTFPIPPNKQHNLFLMQFSFRCCLWWFITLGPWSFSNDVILNNPFFITSFIEWISFNSYGIQISSFSTSKRRCIWRSIVDFGIFNISSISRTVTWRSYLIMALIWSPLTSFGRPERCSSLNENSPERNLSNQFRHCLLRGTTSLTAWKTGDFCEFKKKELHRMF